MPETDQTDLTTLTVQLLSAYVSNNTVPSTELAGLIQSTRTALGGSDTPAPELAPEFAPAVTVRKSLASRDHIISMIDGKSYKTLKRHLATHGLTPAEYRDRYKLPKDYPMVAPGYSEQRREVAKRLGLGRKPAAPAPVGSKDAVLPTPVEPAPVEAVGKPPAPTKPTAAKATSVAPAKDVMAKPARKPRKAAKAAQAATKTSKAAAKSARGHDKKAAPDDQDAVPARASKTRRGGKAAPEVVTKTS